IVISASAAARDQNRARDNSTTQDIAPTHAIRALSEHVAGKQDFNRLRRFNLTASTTHTSEFARLSGQKRHEAYSDEVLLLNSLFPLYQLAQPLWPAVWSERQHHRAALRQFFDQRLRDRFGGRRDDDVVVGRTLRHPGKTVPDQYLDIAIS